MNNVKLCSIFFLFLMTACHQNEKQHKNTTEVNVEDLAADFKLPRKIFDQIDSNIQTDTKNLRPVYLFSPLTVQLTSENNSVVKNSPVQISFPNGGGSVDLKDYVDQQGTFSLSFPKKQFELLPNLESLYYISDVKSKKIDDEEFGLGCYKMAHLEKNFEQLQKSDFLKLNTTNQRYLHVVAGYYVFVFRNNNQVYMTHLHLTDSRYPDQSCVLNAKN
jgi:hypothetical protein